MITRHKLKPGRASQSVPENEKGCLAASFFTDVILKSEEL